LNGQLATEAHMDRIPLHAFMEEQLEPEIDLATRTRVPILITAPAEYAPSIVQKIAARSRRSILQVPLGPAVRDGELMATVIDSRETYDRFGQGSILWFDEVSELTTSQQQLLAGLLQDDVLYGKEAARFVASTRRDLYQLVAREQFDAALFYRLNVIHIVLPGMAPPNGRA
jgi:hypothetical protein